MFRQNWIQQRFRIFSRITNYKMRKSDALWCSIFLATTFPLDLHSQSASTQSLNLQQVIQTAFANNTDLKIIASELEMGRLDGQEEGAELKPQVKAYGKYHWYWADQPEMVFPEDAGSVLSEGSSTGPYPLQVGLPNNLALGMNVEQRVWDQRFLLSKESHELFSSLSENRIKIGKDELAYEIARQYYELNELVSREKSLDFNKKRLEKAVKILEIQVKNSMASETDLEKTRLRLQKVEAGQLRLKNGIKQKSDYIMMIAGITTSETLVITPVQSDTIPLLLMQGNDSIYNSPSFNLLENMKQSNLLKLQMMKANHSPSLDFFADMQWYSQADNLSFFESGAMNNQSFLGLKLDIPIYSGDLFKKQKQKAGIQNDIYRLQQNKIAAGQQLQIDRYKKELESLHTEWEIQRQLENIAQKQLTQAESKFDKEVININDLFTAEEELLNAGKEKNELLLKIKIAEIDLLKASGQLEILYK